MSAETLEWLNVMTLIGCTDARTSKRLEEERNRIWHRRETIVTADAGKIDAVRAWHYRATMQGDEPNHYASFIPVADVERRLFNWQPVRGTCESEGAIMDENGVQTFRLIDEKSVQILRPPGALGDDDPGAILGKFKFNYKIHEFKYTLLENVAAVLDANQEDLGVSAAGLLAEGARAWVEISPPEYIVTPEGVEFRPQLLCRTSLDGSMASAYGMTAQMAICDNTVAIGVREKGRKIKFKHTANSLGKLAEAREKLQIEFASAGDAFKAEVAQLTNVTVSEGDWEKFLTELHPTKDEDGEEKTGRSRTYALNRREELNELYHNDPRCTPWQGTAFGVLQTVNTWQHHVAPFKGGSRPMSNMQKALDGTTVERDADALKALAAVGVEV